MKTENPYKFWSEIQDKENWRDYIIPKRTIKEFDDEGKLQAEQMKSHYDKDTDVVLDYGTGIGRVLKHMRGKRKIGLDISKTFVAKAKKNDSSSEYYTVDDFSETADFIYSLLVLQHNTEEYRRLIINNIFNLLAPHGKTFISFPKFDSDIYKEGKFVHKFTIEEVKSYGSVFDNYIIYEDNLVGYKDQRGKYIQTVGTNEYILVGLK